MFHFLAMKLDAAARMNLMKFVCSFAWTDLKVSQAERDLIMRIAGQIGLTNVEVGKVGEWLQVPPPPEETPPVVLDDPTLVPAEHRQLFFDAAQLMVRADGAIAPAEREQLALFRELLES